MVDNGLRWVLLTALVSGVSVFLNKFGVAGINSSIFTFSKNLIAGIFLVSSVLLLKYHKEILKFTRKDWLLLLAVGFIGGSVPFILFFRGLQLMPAAQAALIHKTLFVWVGIFALTFLREKIDRRFFSASLLLLLGNFLLLGFTGMEFGTGALMVFAATLMWAAENTLSKYALRKMSGPVVACGRMLFGSLFFLLYLIFTDELSLILEITLPQLGWILFASALLFAYTYTWYTGLETLPVSVATSVLLLASPITTLLSMVFTGVLITLAEAAGIISILLGVMIAAHSHQQNRTGHSSGLCSIANQG